MPRNFNFTDMLNKVATVSAYTVAIDSMMGETETFATKTGTGTSGTFPCSLQPIGGGKQQYFGRMNIVVSHVCYTNEVLDIDNGDRITVSGVNYNVVYQEIQGGRDNLNETVFAIYLELKL